MKIAAAYYRYSSFGQREESIEGQMSACRSYAEEHGIEIIHEYIDRAATATNDRRAAFQQMISDSGDGLFDTLLVYQFDRFARDRFDSVLYKKHLRDNGVQVVSVCEPIADDPSGAFLEALLEAQADYFSKDLSRKVKRGQRVNAQQCRSCGGFPTLGYQIDEHGYFQIDKETAPIVRAIFSEFIGGKGIVEIMNELNASGVRAYRGALFSKNTIRRILGNKRYIGTYIFGEYVIEDGIPAIISKEDFETAQIKLNRGQHMRGGSSDYLLSGKVFCGYCGTQVVGVSGTSKTKKRLYSYYACNKARKKKCDKRNVRREIVDDAVVAKCREALTDEKIEEIAEAVATICAEDGKSPYLAQLQAELRKTETAIENLLKALEAGQEVNLLLSRITEKRELKEHLESQVAKEEFAQNALSKPEVRFFLTRLRDGQIDDEKYRRLLIRVLVNKVYLYDDHANVYCNAGKKTVEVKVDFAELALSSARGSYSVQPGQPTTSKALSGGFEPMRSFSVKRNALWAFRRKTARRLQPKRVIFAQRKS